MTGALGGISWNDDPSFVSIDSQPAIEYAVDQVGEYPINAL